MDYIFRPKKSEPKSESVPMSTDIGARARNAVQAYRTQRKADLVKWLTTVIVPYLEKNIIDNARKGLERFEFRHDSLPQDLIPTPNVSLGEWNGSADGEWLASDGGLEVMLHDLMGDQHVQIQGFIGAADEHRAEHLKIRASWKVDGTALAAVATTEQAGAAAAGPSVE